jgi:hypothetical protein
MNAPSAPVEHRNLGLPGSKHREGLCPRCNKQSSFELVGDIPLTFSGLRLIERDGSQTPVANSWSTVLLCRNCKEGISIIEVEYKFPAPPLRPGSGVSAGLAVSRRPIHWYPQVGSTVDASVPEPIKSAIEEAITTLHAGCSRAAAIMARHTLEAFLKTRGIAEHNLKASIDKLASNGDLAPGLKDWCHEVRGVGNAGAHDPLASISKEDAEDLINFMMSLLDYFYVLPAQLVARRMPKPPTT